MSQTVNPDVKKADVPNIDFYYFTDPLCSHCWAQDTTLTRFKHEYGQYLNITTVMGGMIEDGNHFSPNSPEAKHQKEHWEEVGMYYQIPIDGDVWLKSPITSSFPSSIVYLLLKETDPEKANFFLRMVREDAFVFEKNVSDRKVLEGMLKQIGVEPKELLDKAFSEEGKQILYDNFRPMMELGVNGFPTVVMVNKGQNGIKVVGARSLETYKKALLRILPEGTELEPAPFPTLQNALDVFPSIFDTDIMKLYDVKEKDVEGYLYENLMPGTYEKGTAAGHAYVQKK